MSSAKGEGPFVPDSIQTAPLPSQAEELWGADKQRAEQVILEILRQGASKAGPMHGLLREHITVVFWLAHLYYAKSNPGYLTTCSIIRTGLGGEIQDAATLLSELIAEEFVQAKEVEWGPFPLKAYSPTGKRWEAAVSTAAETAIRQAIDHGLGLPDTLQSRPLWGWLTSSRAWHAAKEGEEIDIYLDLIPEDLYEERRRQLESMKAGLEDLFS